MNKVRKNEKSSDPHRIPAAGQLMENKQTEVKTAEVRFLVVFEAPFWVGVWERSTDRRLSVCKVTFGAEPKDCQVYDFLLKYSSRLRFSPAVTAETKTSSFNPKRIQREVRRLTERGTGIGTKSQQALKQQQELSKIQRKIHTREQKEEKKQLQFEQKQQKRREKHRGR